MQTYHILIVEDHPIITHVYQAALNALANDSIAFNIETAINCDDAIEKINCNSFTDLVILDINLPISSDGKYLSGEDLGILIREKQPKAKIIVATAYQENMRLQNIFKSINPEGFLIKKNFTPIELKTAIQSVLIDTPYYSHTVLNMLRNFINQDFHIDELDRQILYELSIGTKMIDLSHILQMSIGGLEKRKRHLKDLFEINKESDRELVAIALKKGFL